MLNDQKNISFTLRFLLFIAVLGLALTFLRVSAEMVNAVVLSWLIVQVFSPLLRWLTHKGLPIWLAFIITLITILLLFVALVIFLIMAFDRFTEAIPSYVEQAEELTASVESFFASLGINTEDIQALLDFIDPMAILEALENFLAGLIGTVSSVFLVILLIVFLMLDGMNAPKKLAEEIKAGNKYLERFFKVSYDVRRYLYITTGVGMVAGTLDTIWFIIWGVDFPVLWGILAFLLSYIPSIGFWLAAIPPSILALLESGPVAGLFVFLGIVVINGFSDNVVKPKFMGEGLNLSPLMVIFSVIFWAGILGPLGAIIGVPMTVLFKELVLEADDQNHWIASLMSSAKEPKQQEAEVEDTDREME